MVFLLSLQFVGGDQIGHDGFGRGGGGVVVVVVVIEEWQRGGGRERGNNWLWGVQSVGKS